MNEPFRWKASLHVGKEVSSDFWTDAKKNRLTLPLHDGKISFMKTILQNKIEALGGYQAVAQRLGIDQSTVFRHLQGRRPSLDILIKYKDLGIVPEDFIDRQTAKQENAA